MRVTHGLARYVGVSLCVGMVVRQESVLFMLVAFRFSQCSAFTTTVLGTSFVTFPRKTRSSLLRCSVASGGSGCATCPPHICGNTSCASSTTYCLGFMTTHLNSSGSIATSRICLVYFFTCKNVYLFSKICHMHKEYVGRMLRKRCRIQTSALPSRVWTVE